MSDDTERAAELYRRARELHEARDYWPARELYEQSLELHEDDEVRAAYLTLLATIGPL